VDELGFILTDNEVGRRPELLPEPWHASRPPYLAETSVPGVFAAGDIRAGSVKRIGSAVGQGAVAVAAVTQYLHTLNEAAKIAERPQLESAADEGHMLEAAGGDADIQPD
jgi:thioredoxin reductase (NADPH)